MNEEIEYAEMLEIPVSTVNVVRKKNKRMRTKNQIDLKDRLISRVNDRVGERTEGENRGEKGVFPHRDTDAFARRECSEGAEGSARTKTAFFPVAFSSEEGLKTAETPTVAAGGETVSPPASEAIGDAAALAAERDEERYPYAYAEGGERIDTVRVKRSRGEKRSFFGRKKKAPYGYEAAGFADYAAENGADESDYGGRGGENYGAYDGYGDADGKVNRKLSVALGVEFGLACALCGAIFLTNVFMPQSAINTFFRSLTADAAKADNRVYSDFTLTPVVSELSDAEIVVSPAGVLSFTDACCVYPAVDGKISAVTTNADGTYDVRISHTDSFYGVIGGLDYVYYAEGDAVAANVPVGYSKGETAVRVTMYAGGELLNCYTVDSENCLSWVSEEG